MVSGYQITLWRGIKAASQKYDVNAICFLGREIYSTVEYRRQANIIYDLINQNSVDGLILLTGTISHFVDQEGLEDYLKRFSPLPMVSIAEELSNFPSILLDNHKGIHEMVGHLVEAHQYKQIGYVRMREGHAEGDIRFEAYKDALKKHKLPYNPDLVVPGPYYDQPEAIVNLLYDERKVNPEALVVSDDYMAIPIMEVLKNRGISVPEDVAIVGFDDIVESRYIEPPLTTLRQPLLEQAHLAVDMIMAALDGTTVPLKTEMSPRLIIRQSCGCSPISIANAAAPAVTEEPQAASLSDYQEQILKSLVETAESIDEKTLSAFLEALISSLAESTPNNYLTCLGQFLQQTEQLNEDILEWQAIISRLRPFILNILQAKPELAQAENLLQQSRVMIAEAARRYQAAQRLNNQAINMNFRNLSQALNTTMNFDELLNALNQDLPKVGIPEFYISFFDQDNLESDILKLILARTSDGRQDLPPQGLKYPANKLLPSSFMDQDRRSAKLVQPLYFRKEQYGFVVFEAQAFDESIYDSLAEQISSGIKGTLLVQQVEHRAIQLQTASEVSQAASSFLDPADLISQVVELVKNRFDLYYVGLFLLDDDRNWAQLRAGTGEAGQKMLSANWRLEVGGDSMIGRCIASAEADIQLDVDKAPVHLRNPYLPETKSELALPLISRGDILGALTIQSTIANAFSSEDITMLQTMVNQISAALANAQLFGQTQNALMETETLLNVSRLANSTIGIDFALPQILDLVLKATQIDAGLFSLFDPETGRLELKAHKIPTPLLDTLTSNGLEGTLCDLVFQQGQPLLLNNLETDSPIDTTELQKMGFRSYQGVPVETRSEIYGTLCTFSKYILNPEDNRMNLLRALGQQIGVAMENSRLFEQTQAALRQTADLFSGSERIVKSNDIQSVLEALVESTALQGMDRAGLLIFNRPWENENRPTNITLSANWTQTQVESRAPVGTEYKLEEYPLAKVLALKKPVFIKDFNTDENIDNNSRQYFMKVLAVKSAISLPLVISGQSIGGIVALSSGEMEFTETEVRQISSLTDQAATVIQSILLNDQTQATLAELEATQRRYQIQAWSSYNQSQENSGYQRTREGLKSIGKQPIPKVKEAIEKQVPLIDTNGGQPTLTVPILLRDQPIGAIGLQAGENKRNWTPEDIALVQEISEQFALAAESLRLLDETQRRAARERLVGEITAKLRATNDPQAMLETAASELRTALKAKRAQVLLQPNQPEASNPGHEIKRGEE